MEWMMGFWTLLLNWDIHQQLLGKYMKWPQAREMFLADTTLEVYLYRPWTWTEPPVRLPTAGWLRMAAIYPGRLMITEDYTIQYIGEIWGISRIGGYLSSNQYKRTIFRGLNTGMFTTSMGEL